MGACCTKDADFGGLFLEDDMNDSRYDDGEEDARVGEDGVVVRVRGSSEYVTMAIKQGKKGINQDAMTVWENFTGEEGMFFCGVFDGHGPLGHKIAHYVQEKLPSRIDSAVKTSELYGNTHDDVAQNDAEKLFHVVEAGLIESFKVIDEELGIDSSYDSFCSGSTAVTIIKRGDCLIIANLGDSRAVLCTRGNKNQRVPVQLTVDLKPDIPSEAERIRACKGRVFAMDEEPNVYRIWMPDDDCPGLAMSRAFGDFCLKDHGLIPLPEVSCRQLKSQDEFVVLASDGVWDVLSNNEVIKTVASAKNRSIAAKLVIRRAAQAWRNKYPGSRADDCTAIILFFKDQPASDDSTSEEKQGSSSCREFSFSGRSGSERQRRTSEPVRPHAVTRVNSIIRFCRSVTRHRSSKDLETVVGA